MLAVPDFAVPVLYGVGVSVTFTLFRVLSPGWGQWPDFARKSVQALLWLASVVLLWTLPDAFRDSPEDPVTFGVKCVGALVLLEALYQTAVRKSLAKRNARPVREGKGEYRPGASTKANSAALFTSRNHPPSSTPPQKTKSIWAFLSEPDKDPNELVTVTQVVLRPPKVSPMVNPLRARQSAEAAPSYQEPSPSTRSPTPSEPLPTSSREPQRTLKPPVGETLGDAQAPFKWTPPASLRLRPKPRTNLTSVGQADASAMPAARGPAHLRAKSKELKSLRDLPGFLHQVDPRYKELGAICQVKMPGATAAPEARKTFVPHIAPNKASTLPPSPIAVQAVPTLKARFLRALKVKVPLPSLVALVKNATFGAQVAPVERKAAEPLEAPLNKGQEGSSRKKRRSSHGEHAPATPAVQVSSLPESSAKRQTSSRAEPARGAEDKRTARSRRRSRA